MIRVMSFNIRFDNPDDGKDAWHYRRDLVACVVERYRPDILGTQEGRWNQLMDLKTRLPQYHLHAPGRVIDDTCQYPTLFILESSFSVLEGDEFWLSETPRIHKSKSWESGFPRMMSFARLRLLSSEKEIWTCVTHLDHLGAEARVRQAVMIAEWASSLKAPLILMGDFNDGPGSQTHAVLTQERSRLRDSWKAMGLDEGTHSATSHGFKGIPKKERIDWVLVSPDFDVKSVSIIRDEFEGRYPSDHFPVIADLHLT
jgi:endonuclease/exonuclease/phosphatase family metal-dependent hydrolase